MVVVTRVLEMTTQGRDQCACSCLLHLSPFATRGEMVSTEVVKDRRVGGDNHTHIQWTSTHIWQPPKPVQHATMKTQPIGHPAPNKCTEQPKPTTKVQLKWHCLAGMIDIATESTKTHLPPEMGFNHRHSNIKDNQKEDSSQNGSGHGRYQHHGTRLIWAIILVMPHLWHGRKCFLNSMFK